LCNDSSLHEDLGRTHSDFITCTYPRGWSKRWSPCYCIAAGKIRPTNPHASLSRRKIANVRNDPSMFPRRLPLPLSCLLVHRLVLYYCMLLIQSPVAPQTWSATTPDEPANGLDDPRKRAMCALECKPFSFDHQSIYSRTNRDMPS